MPLADGQIQLLRLGTAPLLLNQGTAYAVTDFNPWDRGVRADQAGDVPWGDGEWSGAEWRTGATIPLQVDMDQGNWSALMQAYWALDAVLAPVRTGTDVEITWGAGGVEYLMYGRPRGTTMTRRSFAHGTARVTSSLFCPDPAIYSAEEYVSTIGLLHRSGGLAVPFGLPASIYSVVDDGEVTITNAGTAAARLQFRITGPVAEPRITLIDDLGPQTLYLDTVLGADDWLEIDTATKSVVLNGTTSRLPDAWGDWPLLRGTALLRFEADEYEPAARLTITHRSTW
jgi:hypothetical protein